MLPAEIEPFANAHIKALNTIMDEMEAIGPSDSPVLEITREQLDEWVRQLNITRRGYDRFKICMVGEVAAKHRYAEQARTCRLEHRDK